MNKQEAIEKIKNISARETFMSETIWVKRDEVLDIVSQLDEPVKPPEPKPLKPEKPVVPQFVAVWLNYCETKGFSLTVIFNGITEVLRYEFSGDMDKCTHWARSHQKEIAKAWLYGYEVEKEKLYTVRLKATGEFIRFNETARSYHSGTSIRPVAYQEKNYHHAEDALKELLFWDNPAFTIEEVEK